MVYLINQNLNGRSIKMIDIKYSKNGVTIRKVLLKNNYLSISLDTDNFINLSNMIKSNFTLKKDGKMIMDIVGDEGFQDYMVNDKKISMGWNFMEDLYVHALDINSNKLIEDIFEWLQTIEIPE